MLKSVSDHHNTQNGGDGAGLYTILNDSSKIFIAYEDPINPRKKKYTQETQIKDAGHAKIDKTSTPVKTRSAIKKLRLSNDQYTQGRSYINEPSIIHKIHKMKRSELEYIISFAEECKKKYIRNPKTPTPDQPAKRRLITSRLSKRSKEAYNNHLYESHIPIT